MVSILFTIGSTLSLILVFFCTRIIRKIGLVRLAIIVFVLTILSLYIIGNSQSAGLIIPAFIFYTGFNAIILYCFDLFIEHYAKRELLGNIRGLYMSLSYLGWIGAPALAGLLTHRYGFGMAYLVAAGMVLIGLCIILIAERSYIDHDYDTRSFSKTFTLLRKTPLLRRVITINFILQFFFVWMVIYSPLYLHTILQFDLETIGILFSIMLIPYVIFPYRIGKLADRIGERNLIIAGITITAIATMIFALLGAQSALYYGIILFITRIGASITEIATESYFFKQVTDSDTAMIGIFRNMMPFAYIIGPIVGAVLLGFISYSSLFIVLSILLFFGIVYACRLERRAI